MKLVEKKEFKAFTLIELLIVLAIIVAMSLFFINSLVGSQQKARDAERKSDLKQFTSVIEGFGYEHDGYYIGRSGSGNELQQVCDDMTANGYQVDHCPADPTGIAPYRIQSGRTSGGCGNGDICATQFTLRARLEHTDMLWVVCSHGPSGEVATDFDFTGLDGGCPL